jgi:hypothetical protein
MEKQNKKDSTLGKKYLPVFRLRAIIVTVIIFEIIHTL